MATFGAILNGLFIGGMVFGAGVAGLNNANNACQAVKNAVDTLKEAKKAKTNWNNALEKTTIIDIETVNKITENYTNIASYQKSIQEAQAESKKIKAIIIALGLTVIFVLFFYLLYRYYRTKINHVKIMSKVKHVKS